MSRVNEVCKWIILISRLDKQMTEEDHREAAKIFQIENDSEFNSKAEKFYEKLRARK